MENWREKVEKALYEKNAVTDVLAMLEDKTGVKRTYYVAGNNESCTYVHVCTNE